MTARNGVRHFRRFSRVRPNATAAQKRILNVRSGKMSPAQVGGDLESRSHGRGDGPLVTASPRLPLRLLLRLLPPFRLQAPIDTPIAMDPSELDGVNVWLLQRLAQLGQFKARWLVACWAQVA